MAKKLHQYVVVEQQTYQPISAPSPMKALLAFRNNPDARETDGKPGYLVFCEETGEEKEFS